MKMQIRLIEESSLKKKLDSRWCQKLYCIVPKNALKVHKYRIFTFILQLLRFRPFQEKHAKEEEERKRRIQLYVFVLRCVAYNFNAKQPNDMQKRHLKVTKEGHEKMKAKIEVKGKGFSSNWVLISFLLTLMLIYRVFYEVKLKSPRMRLSKNVSNPICTSS